MKITVVFDNNQGETILKPGFGFACLIENEGSTILFDTGSEGMLLRFNLEAVDVSPRDIDCIVISHNHWDHTGGLKDILGEAKGIPVYIPRGFSENFREEIEISGAELIVVNESLQIERGIFTTGEINGLLKEQSLVCETDSGSLIITGCAHPGLIKIVERAESIIPHNYMIMGGFHLSQDVSYNILSLIDNLQKHGIRKVAPMHCTGDKARRMFKSFFGDNCLLGGVGMTIFTDEKAHFV